MGLFRRPETGGLTAVLFFTFFWLPAAFVPRSGLIPTNHLKNKRVLSELVLKIYYTVNTYMFY